MDLREWREAEEPTTAEIKRRQRALRKKRYNGTGLSQIEAAQRLGISQQYFSLLEDGKRSPSDELLARINRVTKGRVLPETFD